MSGPADALRPLLEDALAACAILRGRSARAARLPARHPRPRQDAGRQQRPGREPEARGKPRAFTHGRCLSGRRAVRPRLARACESPPSWRCGACAIPTSRAFCRTPTSRSSPRPPGPINDDGWIEAAVPALARALEERRFTSEPLLRRAINANLRLGTNDAAARVAAFAADVSRPAAMRAEAGAALAVWQSPSPFDRVDGAYHGPPAPRCPSPQRSRMSALES